MNCQFVCEQLSAYFDRELDNATAAGIKLHLAECRECSDCLCCYQQLRDLATSQSEPPKVAPKWEIIAKRLDEKAHSKGVLRSSSIRENFRFVVGTLAALAASLILMIGFYSNKSSTIERTSHASVASIDFKPVIDLFQKDPMLALSHLSEQFVGKEVSIEKAESSFGRPVFAKSAMAGNARLVSTRMLSFPFCKCPEGQCTCGPGGCNCVACVCQRPDGSTYLVLEHCKAQGVTFGDLPVQIVSRGSQKLQQVTVNGLTTISWEGNGGRLTAIGLKNEREIDTLLAVN